MHLRALSPRVVPRSASSTGARAPRPRAVAAGTALMVTLVLSACGAGGGPEETTQRFFDAAGDGDWDEVCGLLDPEFVAAAEAEGESCPDAMAAEDEAADGGLLPDADAVEVGDADVSGDTATVEATLDGATQTVDLVKVDDEWKVSITS